MCENVTKAVNLKPATHELIRELARVRGWNHGVVVTEAVELFDILTRKFDVKSLDGARAHPDLAFLFSAAEAETEASS